MTHDQIAKANAELRNKSALDCVSTCAGARALARFNVHCGVAREISGLLPVRTLKRRERRAPSPSVTRSSADLCRNSALALAIWSVVMV